MFVSPHSWSDDHPSLDRIEREHHALASGHKRELARLPPGSEKQSTIQRRIDEVHSAGRKRGRAQRRKLKHAVSWELVRPSEGLERLGRQPYEQEVAPGVAMECWFEDFPLYATF